MKKRFKLLFLLIILIFILSLFKGINAANSIEKKNVNSWSELKQAIDNSTAIELEIRLTDSISSTWTADSNITIPQSKIVTICSTTAITIKRGASFKGSLITNQGTLIIQTSSTSTYITFDGNKSNVEAERSLLRVESGSLTVSNTILKNNYNKYPGGGLCVPQTASTSTIELNNVRIQNNEASGGGGIYININDCTTELVNVKIDSNQAYTESGGGIYAYGTLNISGSNTQISNNTSKTFGGGVMVKGTCSIDGATITQNKATEKSGGGVRVDGTLALENSSLKNNTASVGGGLSINGWFDAQHIKYTGNPTEASNQTVLIENNTSTSNNCANVHPDLANYKDWSMDTSLKFKKISTSSVKSFKRGSEVDDLSTQGMAIGKDYIVWAQVGEDSNANTVIKIMDKDTYAILGTDNSHCFHHANGITYNKSEDRYYVSYYVKPSGSTTIQSRWIASFQINSNYKVCNIKTKEVSRYYHAIAFSDNYLIAICGKTAFILNKNILNQDKVNQEMGSGHLGDEQYSTNSYAPFVIKTFIWDTNLTKQDCAVYNNYIYYACYESGSMASSEQQRFNSKEKHSNLVYVYDLNGNLIKTLYSSYKNVNAELESICVKDDGTILLSFNDVVNNKVLFRKVTTDVYDPTLQVKYSTTAVTNQSVTATITANEEVQSVSGWTLSSDKKTLTKSYSANATENVTIKDLASNSIVTQIKITNIDKTAPTLSVAYSTTAATNQNVTATITSNEQVQSVSGWTLSSDKKTLTKSYSANATESVTVKDLAGNSKTAQVKITNIDKTAPTLSISYSTTVLTNQNVTATITANEQVKSVTGWTLSSDKKILTKSYSANVNETITVYDLAGNKKTINVKIENISETQLGDLNENDRIDIGDLVIIHRHISATNKASVAAKHPDWALSADKVTLGDLNRNGRLDIGDGLRIQRHIAATNNEEVATQHPDWLIDN